MFFSYSHTCTHVASDIGSRTDIMAGSGSVARGGSSAGSMASVGSGSDSMASSLGPCWKFSLS